MAEQEKQGNFWFYVWFGVSGLMNLSGMASIADGFVVWAKFFHDIIDVYRAVIRQPLAWIGHLIWPFGPIPGWAFDLFVINSAMFLAYSITIYRSYNASLFSVVSRKIRDDKERGVVLGAAFAIAAGFGAVFAIAITFVLIIPAIISVSLDFFSDRTENHDPYSARITLLNFLLILALFTLLLFINWQIRQHGG